MKKKRVLIVRLSSLGDVIFNIPLAAIFKANDYEVTWITSEKGFGVINNNPYVDEAILAPLEKWKKQKLVDNIPEYVEKIKYLRSKNFDIAIDTQGLLKSAIWTAMCGAKRRITTKSAREFAQFAGNEIIEKLTVDFNKHVVEGYFKFAKYLNLDANKIEVALPPVATDVKEKITILLENLNKNKPVITIAPATTWVPKHWDKDNWKALVERLEKDYNLIFTGTSKDLDLIDYIGGNRHCNIAGKTTLIELVEVFKRSDLVVSLDSGSTHLAWACQVPKIVSIFCCTPKTLYGPIGDENKYISLSSELGCQPCHKRKCPLKTNRNRCTMYPSVDDVFNAVKKMMTIKEKI